MEIRKTELEGVLVLEPACHGDARGWFMESFSDRWLEDMGADIRFVQDNHSFSARKGTLRGLHYQREPEAQSKLVRCTRGEILDVAVDLRRASPTYRKWTRVVLSAENRLQLFVPRGFAHGFVTLCDDCEVQYKVDRFYSRACDAAIRYDDPSIGVAWGTDRPILSAKDASAPFLEDADPGF